MTRFQITIRDSWFAVVHCAMVYREPDAAYRLTVAFVRRLKELGCL
jgi:hypothetical protein